MVRCVDLGHLILGVLYIGPPRGDALGGSFRLVPALVGAPHCRRHGRFTISAAYEVSTMANYLDVNALFSVTVVTSYPAAGQVGENRVFGKVFAKTGTGVTTDQAALQLDGGLGVAYKSLWLPTNTYYNGIILSRILPSPRAVQAYSRDSYGQGTVSDGPLPGQVAAILTCQTNFAGPAYRSRLYVPFVPKTYWSNSINGLTDTGKTALTAIAVAWGIGIVLDDGSGNTSTVAWGTYSKGLVFTPWTFIIPERSLATQRRRGAFGQLNKVPGILQG